MRTAGLPESNRTGQRPLPARPAWAAIGRSALTTVHLLARRRIHLPRTHVGWWLHFADGSASWVYRETVVDRATPADPAVLVVAFRLRWVRGIGHRMFRLESLLNTPLFVGFPGLVSKLWLAHDAAGVYRGVYQWDGAQSAGGLRPRLVARSGFGVRPGVDPLSRVCRAPTRRPLASARAGGPGERCGLVADDRHLDTEPLS
ncbi:MAG TPA: hypothetical protein VIT42_04910 [Microlunatus sp.]